MSTVNTDLGPSPTMRGPSAGKHSVPGWGGGGLRVSSFLEPRCSLAKERTGNFGLGVLQWKRHQGLALRIGSDLNKAWPWAWGGAHATS